jgi:hypothetical protein
MKVTNLNKDEQGNHSLNLELTQEESEFLINFALDVLVDKGWIEFSQDKNTIVNMEILKNLPPEAFGTA